jgi:GT2 family glycosyltransferase
VGGFDEGFFLYEEDVDLCVRVRRSGWEVVYTPAAEIVHHLGRSMDQMPARARIEYHRSHLRYYRKHQSWPARLLLRTSLASRAAGLWIAGTVGGAEGRDRRREAAVLLRLALFG